MGEDRYTKIPSSGWKSLYRVGGAAALVAGILFRRNLADEYFLLRSLGVFHSGPTAIPGNALAWFTLLHENPFLGLTLLNLFDVVNYALVGLIFLGLYAALRRVNKGSMTLALAIGLVGVTVYLASNQAFALLSLSDQYAAATTDAQRSLFLAAGQALLAIQNSGATYGNGIYTSYLCVTLACLLMATVMLESRVFSKVTAWCGILAAVFGLGYYITAAFAPQLNAIPISTSAPFLLIWYILTGLRLLRLGAEAPKE